MRFELKGHPDRNADPALCPQQVLKCLSSWELCRSHLRITCPLEPPFSWGCLAPLEVGTREGTGSVVRPHSLPWAWASLPEPRDRPTVSAVCSWQGQDSALRSTVYVPMEGEAATVACTITCLHLCQGREVKNRRNKQLLQGGRLERDRPNERSVKGHSARRETPWKQLMSGRF